MAWPARWMAETASGLIDIISPEFSTAASLNDLAAQTSILRTSAKPKSKQCPQKIRACLYSSLHSDTSEWV
jgi:hypothetical protein